MFSMAGGKVVGNFIRDATFYYMSVIDIDMYVVFVLNKIVVTKSSHKDWFFYLKQIHTFTYIHFFLCFLVSVCTI